MIGNTMDHRATAVVCFLAIIAAASSGYGLESICWPLSVGDAWTYHRVERWDTQDGDLTQIDSLEIIVAGTRQLNDKTYYVLNDSSLYRTHEDGRVWWYDPRAGEEELFSDLWGQTSDKEPEVIVLEGGERFVEYEGVFRGEPATILRDGPFELTVAGIRYSDAYRFNLQRPEGGGEIIMVPGIGLVASSLGDPVSRHSGDRVLIEYRRGSTVIVTHRYTVVQGGSWGSVKAAVDAQR